MPAQNQIFHIYDAYADAIQDASLRATFLGKKYASWALSYLSVNNLGVQWGQTGGPGVVEGTVKLGGCVILMPTQNAQAMSGNGRRLDDVSLMVMRPGAEFCLSATNYNRWFSVFVPNEMQAEWGAAHAAVESSCCFVRIPLRRAERFRSAMERLALMVRKAPSAFDSAAVVNMTTRKLAQTVREALGCEMDPTLPKGRREVPRKEIIREAMDFVDQRAGEYISVQELATAAGVSERTLRTAFREYFSIGPMRFLKLRTLHQARRALLDSDCSVATVTEIATRFGVWEFGRFAHDYHLLFGELPSETLRHLH
jgi:AraC family transcriptional regulator, ethanolamine operon transcriptional activator